VSEGASARLDWWVMSCRAFSRRIEHATLDYLFSRLQVKAIRFGFESTERNGPVREFFAALGIAESGAAITRADFGERCPPLSHRVKEPVTDE
jgi:predicted enzyme involved in methoxymalonyl-ACP biosynthesis